MRVDFTHLGAFLSGAAAVISAIASSRLARKRYARECQERIDEVRRSIHEGYEMGHE